MEKLLDLVKAYEQLLMLDLDNPEAIQTPHQAFGNILNILVSIAVVTGVAGLNERFQDSINVFNIAWFTLFALLAVTLLTRIFYNGKKWSALLSLHLNLATFWIAVTVLFTLFAFWKYADEYSKMILLVFSLLLVLIPVHILRSRLPLKQKLLYIPMLWICTMSLTYVLIPH
jgi:hypothetical protein